MENFEAIIKDMTVEEMEQSLKILQKRIKRKKSPWFFEDGDTVYYVGLEGDNGNLNIKTFELAYEDAEHNGLIDGMFLCKDEKLIKEKIEFDYTIKKLWRLSTQEEKPNNDDDTGCVYYIVMNEEGIFDWSYDHQYLIPIGTPIFYTKEVALAIIEKLNNNEPIPRFIDELID